MLASLHSYSKVLLRQQAELMELFGFESKNSYRIETEQGEVLAYAAEQSKGFLGYICRQLLRHWRRFTLEIVSEDRSQRWICTHPWRWYFTCLEVRTDEGTFCGALERRFSILSKKFVLTGAQGNEIMTVRSPLWRIWTFTFKKDGEKRATVNKKWGGILTEAFTDKDTFLVEFNDPKLTDEERFLLICSGIFIDLMYFEENNRATVWDLLGVAR